MQRFVELSLAAQTAYAELAEQARGLELANAIAGLKGGLKGSFQRTKRKDASYVLRTLRSMVRCGFVGTSG